MSSTITALFFRQATGFAGFFHLRPDNIGSGVVDHINLTFPFQHLENYHNSSKFPWVCGSTFSRWIDYQRERGTPGPCIQG